MTPFDATETQRPATPGSGPARLIDGRGRSITYLRLSVTDRCDFRCVYCMPEMMHFSPKAGILSLEELDRLASVFVASGARKIRITGGEPLVRKDVSSLITRLGRLLDGGGLEELTLSTNGARLAAFAPVLARAGVRRVNVSMDTLNPDVFGRLTRGGDLTAVQAGIASASAAGLKIKINVVALARDNAAEIPDLVRWAHSRGHDITLIETMPMGDVGGDRTDQYLSLAKVRGELESFWTLTDLPAVPGAAGPARYVWVAETGGRLGLITPMSHNFCDSCNRVRLTCQGVLHTCLGQSDAVDLRAILRAGGTDADLAEAIATGLTHKPRGHDFDLAGGAAVGARHMSVTGG